MTAGNDVPARLATIRAAFVEGGSQERSGTWLFDMLRTHPAIRVEPTTRALPGLAYGLLQTRFPGRGQPAGALPARTRPPLVLRGPGRNGNAPDGDVTGGSAWIGR